MKLQRHLKLSTTESDMQRIRVAFASADRKHVDQHFGSACCFMIYSLTTYGHELVEVAEFCETEQDKNHSKLLTKLNLLEGCQAVLCNAVGTTAIIQLLSLGIQPIRVIPGTTISREISQLQADWLDDPPVWLQKFVQQQQRHSNRFSIMEEEGWDE